MLKKIVPLVLCLLFGLIGPYNAAANTTIHPVIPSTCENGPLGSYTAEIHGYWGDAMTYTDSHCRASHDSGWLCGKCGASLRVVEQYLGDKGTCTITTRMQLALIMNASCTTWTNNLWVTNYGTGC
jgi:hypothetical protein